MKKKGKYLSGVMNLKKMISICLLFVILIAFSLWIDKKTGIEPEPMSAEEPVSETDEAEESMSHLSGEEFYLAQQDGKIVIYQADQKTIFCETSIYVEQLSPELQMRLKQKIPFRSEKELFDFLENYSS